GLAFVNKRGRPQDSFRARVMFPIFTDSGDAVAFGGRILPGSTDPAKYKNSSETTIYAKSKTLYGLNWAKATASPESVKIGNITRARNESCGRPRLLTNARPTSCSTSIDVPSPLAS
ncbi:MAG: hypothetical protein EBZ45_04465, partial [Actinobacteria bacterium]|nr:hypothetical protein [Actinomycetota bacterium]